MGGLHPEDRPDKANSNCGGQQQETKMYPTRTSVRVSARSAAIERVADPLTAGSQVAGRVYVSWTRERRRLRFSKSGNPNLEKAYSTHWLPPPRWPGS
jgi:hypothetical protein